MEENDLQWMGDYLSGALSDAERQRFEQRLEEDPAFSAAFESRRGEVLLLKALSRAQEKDRLRASLKAVSKRKPVLRPMYIALAVAAALALLFVVRNVFFIPQEDLIQLAESLYEPYPLAQVRSPEAGSSLDSIAGFYNNGQFSAALPGLQRLHASNPDDYQITLVLADCLSQLDRHPEAIALLEQIPADSQFAEAGQWYLALNLILDDRPTEAQPILETIEEGPHFRQEEAALLLHALK